jgi:hypothetical protein
LPMSAWLLYLLPEPLTEPEQPLAAKQVQLFCFPTLGLLGHSIVGHKALAFGWSETL